MLSDCSKINVSFDTESRCGRLSHTGTFVNSNDLTTSERVNDWNIAACMQLLL